MEYVHSTGAAVSGLNGIQRVKSGEKPKHALEKNGEEPCLMSCHRQFTAKSRLLIPCEAVQAVLFGLKRPIIGELIALIVGPSLVIAIPWISIGSI